MTYVSEASQLDNIIIAIAPSLFKERIARLVEDSETYYKGGDIQSLHKATLILHELGVVDPRNPHVERLKNQIDMALDALQTPILKWLDENMQLLRIEVNKISPNLYRRLFDLVNYLSFERIDKISPVDLRMLILLCDYAVSEKEQQHTPTDALPFIRYLKAVFRQPRTSEADRVTA